MSTQKGNHEDVLIVPLSSNKRKKIAQALSNETAVIILQELADKPSSAAELAERLDIPLTTVKYSIDALLEAELIQVESVKLSQKRREMKFYAPVKRALIFAPEKTERDALRLLRRVFPYFLVLILILPLAILLRDLVLFLVITNHEITLTPHGAAFYAFIAGGVFALIALLLIKGLREFLRSFRS